MKLTHAPPLQVRVPGVLTAALEITGKTLCSVGMLAAERKLCLSFPAMQPFLTAPAPVRARAGVKIISSVIKLDQIYLN